ncbi:hypothetical protein BGX38DRAFT_895215 [Terfezia claveryi]|nr:hypothetical protein BGX38DRAFT_895215 [Terfezia claveryi]
MKTTNLTNTSRLSTFPEFQHHNITIRGTKNYKYSFASYGSSDHLADPLIFSAWIILGSAVPVEHSEFQNRLLVWELGVVASYSLAIFPERRGFPCSFHLGVKPPWASRLKKLLFIIKGIFDAVSFNPVVVLACGSTTASRHPEKATLLVQ